MRACPDCKTAYSDRDTHCARDGAMLVDLPRLEATASLALAPDSPPVAKRRRSSRPRSSEEKRRASRRRASSPRRRGGTRLRRRHSAEAKRGEVLGSYKIIGVLGQGGMGTVFRAEHTRLGRQVALKLLHDEYTKSRDTVARFFREAKAVNRIRHRNIVDITDLCETGEGSSFIIMELLKGKPLSKVIRSGDLSTERALNILLQICDGLSAAHAENIVHRDLKPDNIFICNGPDGRDHVKLLDFGVAKLLSDNEETRYRTAAGAVVGTPAFMSPEQAGSLRVDSRADLYSLGAIMYEMFTGRPPFRAKTFGEYVRMHLDRPPTAPHRIAGAEHINPELEAVILRCLEKKPSRRYQSAEELRNALLGVLATGDAAAMPTFRKRAVGSNPAPTPGDFPRRTPARMRAPSPRPGSAPPIMGGTPETMIAPMPTPANDQYLSAQVTKKRRWPFVLLFLTAALAGTYAWATQSVWIEKLVGLL